MGQFLTYVLVPGDTKDVQAITAGLLAPYNKAVQVAEHEAKCPCLYASVAAKAGEMADARVQMADSPAGGSNMERNQLLFDRVTKYALDLQNAQKSAIQELLDKAAPDPNCKECRGSGTIRTTANPNGKWTAWKIGSHLQPGFVLERCLTDIPDYFDIVPVKLIDLKEAPMPIAIITPDGQWHAWGEPYWFGTARIDDLDWENTVRKILDQHKDSTLVVVGCQS